MYLCGTWHQRILEVIPPGTLNGVERLGCPKASMEDTVDRNRTRCVIWTPADLIWDGATPGTRIGTCNSNPKIHVPIRRRSVSMKLKKIQEDTKVYRLRHSQGIRLVGGQNADRNGCCNRDGWGWRSLRNGRRQTCGQGTVVIETTTNVWDVYDIVAPLGELWWWRMQER